jgi:hypothetical protein
MALTCDVNTAAVAQIILNRILAANSKPLAVNDIAEACSLSRSQVHDALVELQGLGLVACDGDLAVCDNLQPLRLVLRVQTVDEANLFNGTPGMTSDGTPSLLAAPVYIGGYWYEARLKFALNGGEVTLIVDQWTHGAARAAVLEQAFESEALARDFLLQWTPTEVGGVWLTCPYKGESCEVRVGTREHDGETLTILDLMAEGKAIITFNGDSADDCMRQLRAWHATAANEFNTSPSSPAAGGRKKKGTS